jgi:hypothetical protein
MVDVEVKRRVAKVRRRPARRASRGECDRSGGWVNDETRIVFVVLDVAVAVERGWSIKMPNNGLRGWRSQGGGIAGDEWRPDFVSGRLSDCLCLRWSGCGVDWSGRWGRTMAPVWGKNPGRGLGGASDHGRHRPWGPLCLGKTRRGRRSFRPSFASPVIASLAVAFSPRQPQISSKTGLGLSDDRQAIR